MRDEALTTRSAGNIVSDEINRNKRSPLCGVAPIEVADEALTTRSVGNIVRAEINRNKRSPLCGVAPIE